MWVVFFVLLLTLMIWPVVDAVAAEVVVVEGECVGEGGRRPPSLDFLPTILEVMRLFVIEPTVVRRRQLDSLLL